MSCMINSAVITPVLAAGSVTSPFFYQVNITQRLCSPSCITLSPSFNPIFTMTGISNVGVNQYIASINVEGIIAYVPCNGDACCTRTQLISQTFAIPFVSATAPSSVTVSAGNPINAIIGTPCADCSREFVSETPLTLTVA